MFLHGFPEAAFVWDGMLGHFAKPENGGYRCIAPNLRGFERSSAPADVATYRPKHLVQDIAALIAQEGGQLACLVAHDWGGAVAWNLAAAQPAYMNFLIRPDAEALLAENDFRRLWEFFTQMGAVDGPHPWLTEAVKVQYRAVWAQGLTGPCNYYRASPLRPPRPGPPHNDPAAAAVTIPREMLEVILPTLVIWATGDTALPPALLNGLDDFVPQMLLRRVEGATHWIMHEQPELVAGYLQQFLR